MREFETWWDRYVAGRVAPFQGGEAFHRDTAFAAWTAAIAHLLDVDRSEIVREMSAAIDDVAGRKRK